MLDALNQNIKNAKKKSEILDKFDLRYKEYYLLTLHRPYNVDEPRVLPLCQDDTGHFSTLN